MSAFFHISLHLVFVRGFLLFFLSLLSPLFISLLLWRFFHHTFPLFLFLLSFLPYSIPCFLYYFHSFEMFNVYVCVCGFHIGDVLKDTVTRSYIALYRITYKSLLVTYILAPSSTALVFCTCRVARQCCLVHVVPMLLP